MALLISVRPRFASLILKGTKKVELRRVRPRVGVKDPVFLYATLPVQAVVGYCLVSHVVSEPVRVIWELVESVAGLTWEEFEKYYVGTNIAHAIFVGSPVAFSRPITLSDLQVGWPGFRPPQSYRYIPQEHFALFPEGVHAEEVSKV